MKRTQKGSEVQRVEGGGTPAVNGIEPRKILTDGDAEAFGCVEGNIARRVLASGG